MASLFGVVLSFKVGLRPHSLKILCVLNLVVRWIPCFWLFFFWYVFFVVCSGFGGNKLFGSV